jgi:hypothetical protein
VILTKEKLSKYAFWGLLGINLLYLNGLATNFFKLNAIFSPLILVCCLVIIFTTPRPKFNSYSIVLLLSFYFLYLYIATISLLTYPENLHYKTDLFLIYKSYVSSLLIYFSIFQYIQFIYKKDGIERVNQILNIVSYFLLVPLFFTVFGKEIGLTEAMTYTRDYGDRQIGIFSNPNTTGLHANYILCFVLYSVMASRKPKLFWLILIPVCCYAAFLSLSKAAMLMVVVNILIYLLFSIFAFKRLKLGSRLTTLFAICVIACSVVYINANFNRIINGLTYAQVHRLSDAIELSQGKINDKTTSERSGYALLVFPKVKDHFLIGNGFGTLHRLKETGLGVHNTALLVIGESGIIPSLIFILFTLVYIFKSLIMHKPEQKYLFISGFISYLLICFLTSHNGLEERMSNVILAILVSILSLKEENSNQIISI